MSRFFTAIKILFRNFLPFPNLSFFHFHAQLSRPAYTVADQMNVLDSLHQLTHNRNLVFGPGNYEQEFIGCLSHCLLQLSEDIESSQNKKRTTWHVETPTAISVASGAVDILAEGTSSSQVYMEIGDGCCCWWWW